MDKSIHVKDWMDTIVNTVLVQKENMEFCNQIKMLPPDNAYFFDTGIEVVADLLGVPLEYEYQKDRSYPHIYTFVYREVTFKQVEQQPLEGVNHV